MTPAWKPLPEGLVRLIPWTRMHPEDLAELIERAGLEPCEAVECEVRNLETGKRELYTQFRELAAEPAPPVRASDDPQRRLAEVRRAMGEGAGR